MHLYLYRTELSATRRISIAEWNSKSSLKLIIFQIDFHLTRLILTNYFSMQFWKKHQTSCSATKTLWFDFTNHKGANLESLGYLCPRGLCFRMRCRWTRGPWWRYRYYLYNFHADFNHCYCRLYQRYKVHCSLIFDQRWKHCSR